MVKKLVHRSAASRTTKVVGRAMKKFKRTVKKYACDGGKTTAPAVERLIGAIVGSKWNKAREAIAPLVGKLSKRRTRTTTANKVMQRFVNETKDVLDHLLLKCEERVSCELVDVLVDVLKCFHLVLEWKSKSTTMPSDDAKELMHTCLGVMCTFEASNEQRAKVLQLTLEIFQKLYKDEKKRNPHFSIHTFEEIHVTINHVKCTVETYKSKGFARRLEQCLEELSKDLARDKKSHTLVRQPSRERSDVATTWTELQELCHQGRELLRCLVQSPELRNFCKTTLKAVVYASLSSISLVATGFSDPTDKENVQMRLPRISEENPFPMELNDVQVSQDSNEPCVETVDRTDDGADYAVDEASDVIQTRVDKDIQNGEFCSIIIECTQALEQDETNFDKRRRRALAYYKVQLWKEAEEDFAKLQNRRQLSAHDNDLFQTCRQNQNANNIGNQPKYYDILGVKPTQPSQASRRYKQLAVKLHPDKHSGSVALTELFQYVTTSKEVLMCDQRRLAYNATLR